MITKITSVGRNLNTAITTAEIGSIILGNAVLRMRRWPAVIDLTPPVSEFATR
jgi:CheY-specific phosphatase CheX